jgi:hypothetical protein
LQAARMLRPTLKSPSVARMTRDTSPSDFMVSASYIGLFETAYGRW